MSTYEAPKYNSEVIRSCPNDTEKYPYGCYCKNSGKFFDKKVSYSCVDSNFFLIQPVRQQLMLMKVSASTVPTIVSLAGSIPSIECSWNAKYASRATNLMMVNVLRNATQT